MNKQKRLTLGMGIFAFFIFVAFGSIIVTEKAAIIMAPKIEKKLTNYLYDNYQDLLGNIDIGKTSYKNTKFYTKITDKNNKYHYFYINYQNKQITDTYKKDYVEAKPLMNHLVKVIEDEIKQKTDKDYKVKMSNTYPNFTTMVQERLLKEENLSELRCYIIEDNIMIDNWNKETISKEIINYINDLEKENVTPNNFSLTITNKKDITKSIKIDNITTETANKKEFINVIDNILKNKNDDTITNNRISYRYLN